MAGLSTGTGAANPTAPKLYTVELGQSRCIAILRELLQQHADNIREDEVTGCVLYQGRTTGDGHWQIQRRPRYATRESRRSNAHENRHRAYYVHRIAYVALHGQDIGLTGSHLCGNGNCFNPYHIRDESQLDNNSRQRCLGFVVCPHHRLVLHKLCSHDPPCIKPPVEASQCCLREATFLEHDSQETPPPIIGLPLVQRVGDFLATQHNLPESQFAATSEESAQDQLMSDASDSQDLPPSSSQGQEVAIRSAELPSSSQGPEYGGEE